MASFNHPSIIRRGWIDACPVPSFVKRRLESDRSESAGFGGPKINSPIPHSRRYRPPNDIADGHRQQVPPKETEEILPSMRICIIARKDKTISHKQVF
jgi:hypothetical protein